MICDCGRLFEYDQRRSLTNVQSIHSSVVGAIFAAAADRSTVDASANTREAGQLDVSQADPVRA